MGKVGGGAALLLLALFMLVGFARSDVDASSPSTLVALLITVALPGAAGAALLASHFRAGGRVAERREALRQHTLQAEVLRLAAAREGRLTVVEVVSELALPAPAAKALLDGMVTRELADIEVTDSGVLVYAFHDIRHLGEKPHARGVLDA